MKFDAVEGLGRAGLVAKAAMYAVIGILAAKVALGAREESPDRSGALRAIAAQPFGRTLLVVLALGLAGYAVWRFAQAFADRDDEGTGPKALAKRAGAVARGGWYGLLCALTVAKVVGADDGGGESESKQTAGVLALPFGRWIVLAAGLAFVAAAGFNVWRAVTCRFERKLEKGRMNDAEKGTARAVGIAGHLARGVVFGLVGVFLAKAALEFDADEAVGLDGALLKVAQQPYGGAILGAVAAGLVGYALYCVVQARYRDV